MTKWEYLTLTTSYMLTDEILKKYGNISWELVSVVPYTTAVEGTNWIARMYFKRPLTA